MERVGRYEIVRELGRGSMSIVYEGFDGRIDRHLAIKVLRQRYARDVAARQRFLREARAAGGLAHPNIVTVFDVGQAEATPYLVMEFLKGGTLEDWLERDRLPELDTGMLIELAIQLARGLAYAHQHGVIHRDIKPANIHYDPKTNVSKMMDFGIAAIERSDDAESDNRIAGTMTHMAPELLDGRRADAQSDLYSLGVVLYQLLSGKLPFDAQDLETLIQQIARHETRPLKPLHSDTPRELVDLTYRLMALEPESRPGSASQVADELNEIREGIHSGIVQAVRRKSAPWRWPLFTGIGVALVLVMGLNYLYRTQNEAMAETTFGFGDALTSLIAQETAEALILEDTTALSVLVSDFAANPEIRYLHISDTSNMVRASTNPYMRGEEMPSPIGTSIERDSGSVELTRSEETGLLEFQVPIRFQARRVGQVRLGLDGSGLDEAANATLSMLVAVFCASLFALGFGLTWMTRRQQLGLKRLGWGLKRLQRGQFEFRLEANRRDEFASVFSQFNRLAVRLDELNRRTRRRNAAADNNRSAALEFPPDTLLDETLDLETTEPGTASKGDDALADEKPKVTPLRRHQGTSD
ncbi:MAG TPA: protein kinase [Wenzhouxiangellaceae bacterium]|nr:protein kinase [Wenzhouxiangellaceae bacterium]